MGSTYQCFANIVFGPSFSFHHFRDFVYVNAVGYILYRTYYVSRLDVNMWNELCTPGAGQTVKRQMVTYRITALGEELAGFGQVVKGLGILSPFVPTLRGTQASGKSMDLDFPT